MTPIRIFVINHMIWKIVPGPRKVESLKDRGKRVAKPIFKLTTVWRPIKVIPPQDLSKIRNNYFYVPFQLSLVTTV